MWNMAGSGHRKNKIKFILQFYEVISLLSWCDQIVANSFG